jgi:hypothetical protein
MNKIWPKLMVNSFSLDKNRKGTSFTPDDLIGTSNIPLTRVTLPVRIVVQREP